jgi:hypothetical protein
MAETITQITQPPEFIEAAGKTYLTDLQKAIGQYKAADLSQTMGPQFVAGLSPLQQQAIGQAGGLGSYAPYLQQASALTGPSAYQAYMSPYQQDVIGTTLQQYDIQAAKGIPALASQAIQSGAYGGARQGVAQAEYQSQSDLNRAALQAQLLGEGFGQAQQLAQQDYLRNIQLAQQAPSISRFTNCSFNYIRRTTTRSNSSRFNSTTTIITTTTGTTINSSTTIRCRYSKFNIWIPRSNSNWNSTFSKCITNWN